MRIDLFLFGYACFALDAGESTPFFEWCRRAGFSPKGLVRDEKNGEIRFSTTLREAGRLREQLPDLWLRELGRGGIPVLAARAWRRPGMLVGVFLALLLLVAARLFVWEVEIEGAERIDERELREELALAGLSRGAFLPLVDGDAVSLALRQGDGRIAYANVNFSGTVARVQVRESAQVPDPPSGKPANLVAKCDGVVVMPLVFEGQCLVKEGDVVRAGQILASGVLDTDNHGYRLTHASGQILARTVRSYTVHVPLAYEEKVYTGRSDSELSLFFFGWQGKLFKNTGKSSTQCDIIETIKEWRFSNGRVLPFGYVKAVANEFTYQAATRTVEQARALALAQLAEQLAADSVGRALLSRTVELQSGADGITLVCTAVFEEDIATTVEISTKG